ncbi:cytochrome c biogenesis protein ResB [Paludibacterium paludis]|uniref:Cytochrome c biogenesis protein n=1 Tax=Paludibacterium paludis TaxID=1225769 RepID=A0A918U8A3_9NEIS|nr:cytochrome c biogenesis protein ResB [Paludibacterium paludis]GGY09115.1 cytochrome c biogenesis protein [Paludibacterium paludis]
MKHSSRTTSSFPRALYELLSSMRFAIGLLTVLAIASIVGTWIKQGEAYPNYAFEFGQYWFQVFDVLGIYDVYHSAWFLTILAFLMLSTTLCIARNGPGFIKDIRSFRDKASARSLAAMRHTALVDGAADRAAVTARLQAEGFRFKVREREDGTTLIAAKKGSANRLGYFFAHIALVVICIGGLLDGNLPLKLAELAGRVVPETRDDIPQSRIPAHSRLSTANLSFRGNAKIVEGRSADVVFLNAGQGYLVQELPFIVTLKKFDVAYYSNGMPKSFISDVVVTDKATGKTRDARISVNHPLVVDGIAIYQASFGDGGSPLKLTAWNLDAPATPPVEVNGVSTATQPLTVNGKRYALEFGDLRVYNIEDMGKTQGGERSLGQRLKDAREVRHEKQLKNVGPSITFKLRDAQGQAREYLQYMAPITQDGAMYQISGMRAKVAEPFQYLRIPLDDAASIDTFMRLRGALADPAMYDEVAARSAAKALEGKAISPDMKKEFADSVKWVLTVFARGGFAGLENFLEEKVPADKRQAVAQTYIKILQGAIIDVMAVADRKAGAEPLKNDAQHYRFLLDSLVAYSALKDYGSPVYLQMTGFDQVQASGLQLTRSPGKNLVYLGSLMMVLGIILMFYIRELRLWVLLEPGRTRLAMSANRHSRDLDGVFARWSAIIETTVRGK